MRQPSAVEAWNAISPEDYERHMGPLGADQLEPLAALFGEAYARLRPARVLVLGCATGNGFEHVDPRVTTRLVGVDVSPAFLAVACERFGSLGPRLELRCEGVEACALEDGGFDLVYAGLLFEHVDPAIAMDRCARWLAPAGRLAIVLQLPSEGAPMVTATAIPSIAALADVMHLVSPEALVELARGHGLREAGSRVVPVAHGKRLWACELVRLGP